MGTGWVFVPVGILYYIMGDCVYGMVAIMNNKDGPYWNKSHPDHDKMVQQVYTLREMLTK